MNKDLSEKDMEIKILLDGLSQFGFMEMRLPDGGRIVAPEEYLKIWGGPIIPSMIGQ